MFGIVKKSEVAYFIKMKSLPNVRCPRSVILKVLDCGIVVSEFEFQKRYYVYFRTNTLGKGMNPVSLLAMG